MARHAAAPVLDVLDFDTPCSSPHGGHGPAIYSLRTSCGCEVSYCNDCLLALMATWAMNLAQPELFGLYCSLCKAQRITVTNVSALPTRGEI